MARNNILPLSSSNVISLVLYYSSILNTAQGEGPASNETETFLKVKQVAMRRGRRRFSCWLLAYQLKRVAAVLAMKRQKLVDNSGRLKWIVEPGFSDTGRYK
jgi:hypothetical protein